MPASHVATTALPPLSPLCFRRFPHHPSCHAPPPPFLAARHCFFSSPEDMLRIGAAKYRRHTRTQARTAAYAVTPCFYVYDMSVPRHTRFSKKQYVAQALPRNTRQIYAFAPRRSMPAEALPRSSAICLYSLRNAFFAIQPNSA